MHHPLAMDALQRPGQGRHQGDGATQRPALLSQDVRQRSATDVLEDQERPAIPHVRIEDADQARVVELGQDAALVEQFLTGFLGQSRAGHLEHHVPAQHRVNGPIDLALPASPQPLHHAITPDGGRQVRFFRRGRFARLPGDCVRQGGRRLLEKVTDKVGMVRKTAAVFLLVAALAQALAVNSLQFDQLAQQHRALGPLHLAETVLDQGLATTLALGFELIAKFVDAP